MAHLHTLQAEQVAMSSILLYTGSGLGVYWSGVTGEEPWRIPGVGTPTCPVRSIVTMRTPNRVWLTGGTARQGAMCMSIPMSQTKLARYPRA